MSYSVSFPGRDGATRCYITGLARGEAARLAQDLAAGRHGCPWLAATRDCVAIHGPAGFIRWA